MVYKRSWNPEQKHSDKVFVAYANVRQEHVVHITRSFSWNSDEMNAFHKTTDEWIAENTSSNWHLEYGEYNRGWHYFFSFADISDATLFRLRF